jgi:cytochrome b pre-mRNA-processing protein 3
MRKLMQRLTGRVPSNEAAASTYAAIVAQSRRPEFYARDRVPDTVTGRFSVLVMNLVTVIPWLEQGRGDGGTLAQAVLDLFVADMDSSLRELGVGDLSVGKKMRKLAGAYVTLRQVYVGAFSAPPAASAGAVAEAVRLNIDPEGETEADLAALTAYVLRLRNHLATLDPATLDRDGPASLFVDP